MRPKGTISGRPAKGKAAMKQEGEQVKNRNFFLRLKSKSSGSTFEPPASIAAVDASGQSPKGRGKQKEAAKSSSLRNKINFFDKKGTKPHGR